MSAMGCGKHGLCPAHVIQRGDQLNLMPEARNVLVSVATEAVEAIRCYANDHSVNMWGAKWSFRKLGICMHLPQSQSRMQDLRLWQ